MVEGGLHSSYIANCVFNGFFSYTATMLNCVTIHAIRTTSSLPKPLKTLLLSLTVSDLGVGLLVQPMFIAYLVKKVEQATENNPTFDNAYLITVNLFRYASFFGVMALSVDRFVATHLHLRYQELVTHKRVVAAVISIWVFSAFLSLIRLWTPVFIIYVVFVFIEVACIITATFINYKIYVVVRRHVHQIRALQVQHAAQSVEIASAGRQKKSAIATVYVYLVFLVCYLPNICILSTWITVKTSEPSTVIQGLSLYTLTLVFLNSSLNPLVYCWKMRHIRHAFRNIIRSVVFKIQSDKASREFTEN